MPTLEDGEWENEELTEDIANLGAEFPTGPDGVEEASPGDTTEPQPATQAEMSESESPDGEEPIPEFDTRFHNDFEGLMYIGKLTDSFTWLGHRLSIKTLTTDEILEVGLIHRDYIGTVSDAKAYQAAVVAACIEMVDGQPLPIPLSNVPSDTHLINKFRYVNDHWFPPTLDVVYERYLLLEDKVRQIIEAMGKASG